MADEHRADDADQGKRYFRSSDRVFRQADGWYYSLREGDRGPYATEQEARGELERFIQEQKDLKDLAARTSMKKELKKELGVERSRPRGDVWEGLPDVD